MKTPGVKGLVCRARVGGAGYVNVATTWRAVVDNMAKPVVAEAAQLLCGRRLGLAHERPSRSWEFDGAVVSLRGYS